MQIISQETSVQQNMQQPQSESAGMVVRAAAKAYLFFLKLRNTLGHQWAMLTDYVSPAAEDMEDAELNWVGNAVLSVLYVIDGDDPYEVFCHLEPSVRLEALRSISETYAKMLNIPVVPLELSADLAPNNMGYYQDVTKTITINARLVDEQPISVETAKQAIGTVIHETYHAYQYRAAYSPKKYGLDPTVAARWRENARNYCSFEENPMQYWLQPLEVYARYIEENLQKELSNTQLVHQLQNQINQIMQEGK